MHISKSNYLLLRGNITYRKLKFKLSLLYSTNDLYDLHTIPTCQIDQIIHHGHKINRRVSPLSFDEESKDRWLDESWRDRNLRESWSRDVGIFITWTGRLTPFSDQIVAHRREIRVDAVYTIGVVSSGSRRAAIRRDKRFNRDNE